MTRHGRVQGLQALVTGAAQGLGLACAQRLAEEGATVVLTDLNEERGRAAAAALGATFLKQDVADEEHWQTLARHLESNGLHILVNNAGIEGDISAAKDPEHALLDDWNRIFAVNTAGVFLACKHMIPILAASGGGSIVNFSSVASLVPTPFLMAYGAAKAAVEHLTRSVALHCAERGYAVRCNSVHPGQIMTPMLEGLFARQGQALGTSAEAVAAEFVRSIPMGCYQEPHDIANLVLFLASAESRYVTGQAIACDGGFTLTH